MSADVGAQALQFAIETTNNALKIEEENKKLKEQLEKNLLLIEDYQIASPRALSLKKQLDDKEKELEKKRNDLIELQNSIIATLKDQQNESAQSSQQNLESVPIVVNRIQQFVTGLTDAAVDQHTIAVPILSIFKVNDSLNKLFDALVQSGIIDESPEEKQARIQQFVQAQQTTLANLKAILQRHEPAQATPRPRVTEVAEDAHPAQQPSQPAPTEAHPAPQVQQEAAHPAAPAPAAPAAAPAPAPAAPAATTPAAAAPQAQQPQKN